MYNMKYKVSSGNCGVALKDKTITTRCWRLRDDYAE